MVISDFWYVREKVSGRRSSFNPPNIQKMPEIIFIKKMKFRYNILKLFLLKFLQSYLKFHFCRKILVLVPGISNVSLGG